MSQDRNEIAVIADCENGKERQFLSESIDKISLGHGLVVDRFKWVARPGQEDYENLELSLLRSTHPFFREERIYGPGWPPYRRMVWFRRAKANDWPHLVGLPGYSDRGQNENRP